MTELAKSSVAKTLSAKMPPRKNVRGLDGSGISAPASVTTASSSGGRSSGRGVNEGRFGGGEAATKGSPFKREKTASMMT
jgi:hypothetical protein